MKALQIVKDRFGSLIRGSMSCPSKAQKGMKADADDPSTRCGGWLISAGSTPQKKGIS